MAILPIDLQTLYTQLDKVGKLQVQQQVAQQAAREAEMKDNRLSAENRLKTVQELETGDEVTGKVHDRDADGKENARAGEKKPKDKEGEDAAPPEPPKQVIRDTTVGRIIDITG